jgi:hypothetical protein
MSYICPAPDKNDEDEAQDKNNQADALEALLP